MASLELYRTQFSILQNISQALVEDHDIRSISMLMLDMALSYTNAEKGSVMLLNSRDHLTILAARGLEPQFIRNYTVKVGEGIAGRVAKKREAVLVEDIRTDPHFHDTGRDRYRTRSFISCPLVSKKKLLGVLNVNDKKDMSPFSQHEFELVKSIANHAAIALENVLLLNELKSKASDLEKVNKKMIENNIARNDFLMRISHELRTPLNSVKGAIYHLRDRGEAVFSERIELQDIIATETDKLTALVDNLLNFLQLGNEERITEKSLVMLVPHLQELIESRTVVNLLAQRGLRISLQTPNEPAEIVGDKFRVTQLFQNLLAGIAPSLHAGDTIQLTLTNAEYVEVVLEIPRRLPKSVMAHINEMRHVFRQDYPDEIIKLYLARSIADAHQWNLYAVNQDAGCRVIVAVPKSVKELQNALVNAGMSSFTDYIAERLNVNICSIMLSDDLTNELTVRGARGLTDDVVQKTRIRPGDRISGWVAMEGKPLLIENIENDPRFSRKSIPQYHTKSLLSLPLKIDGRVVGVMNLNNKKDSEPFSHRDCTAAQIIGDKISEVLKSILTNTYDTKDFHGIFASLDANLHDFQDVKESCSVPPVETRPSGSDSSS